MEDNENEMMKRRGCGEEGRRSAREQFFYQDPADPDAAPFEAPEASACLPQWTLLVKCYFITMDTPLLV